MKTILRYSWYQENITSIGQSMDSSTIFGNCRLWESAFQRVFSSLTALSLVSFWSCTSYPSPVASLIKGFWLLFHFYHASFWMNMLVNGELTFWKILPNTWLLGFMFWLLFVGLSYRLGKSLDPVISKADREFMQNFSLSQSSFLQSQLFIEPILTTIYYLPASTIFCMITKEWLVFPIGLMTVLAGHLAGHALNRLLFERRIFSRRNSWHAWLWIAFVFVLYVLAIVFRNQLSSGMLVPILLVQPFLIWFSYGYLEATNQPPRLSFLLYGRVLANG